MNPRTWVWIYGLLFVLAACLLESNLEDEAAYPVPGEDGGAATSSAAALLV
jgi:hypothetical protein